MFTLTDIIEIAMQIEKNGESTYRRAQRKTSDPSLADLLGLLADEELEHQRWFTEFKAGWGPNRWTRTWKPWAGSCFRASWGKRPFPWTRRTFPRLRISRTVMRISAEFEQDTVVFYEMLEPFVEEPRSREDLRLIIEEEKGHLRGLQERLGNPLWGCPSAHSILLKPHSPGHAPKKH